MGARSVKRIHSGPASSLHANEAPDRSCFRRGVVLGSDVMKNVRHTMPVETRLLAIAADELRLHGPKHITVVGIADAAGMTHANVYRYFANKAALIDAVAGQWLRRMEATIADIADSPDPAD